jgi:hypothetical protein
MAEHTTVVFGIPIPSTSRVFLAIVLVHVIAGLGWVVSGLVAVMSVNRAILIRTSIADPFIMIGLLVFLAGFRHLIRQARQEYEAIQGSPAGMRAVAQHGADVPPFWESLGRGKDKRRSVDLDWRAPAAPPARRPSLRIAKRPSL